MKNLCLTSAFLFCCLFQSIIKTSVDNATTTSVAIVEEISTFIENNQATIDPIIQDLLKLFEDYLATKDDELLNVALEILSENDPLYAILRDYFAAKESSVSAQS